MDTSVLKDILGNPLVQVSLTILTLLFIQAILHETIGRIVRRAVRNHKYHSRLDEKKREDTLIKIFRTMSAVILWVVGIISILSQLHVNLAALATGAGLFGLIIGIGAQAAIGDFLAGIFIIGENQFRVGDIVTLTASGKEISGVVEDISIRITRLRDLDGNLHTVRNGLTTIVTNRTFDYANVNVDISVAYESDIDTVERVINEVGAAMAADPEWEDRIKEPIAFLRVDGFEDSAIRVKALGKVQPAAQWDVAGEFRRRVKKAFEKAGVTIPFPQVVVHDSKQK